ncbi:mechanosensitive ion channel protein MscL [Paenibacillus macquariensis subsp. defensor]|uniref:Large conductance mechanosensitive channel n=2 Tax=Paenibacillus macquariensis TaxID=948756 RepID=A0ABY1K393_9BACL|nr:mechanosensitive ion channel protein MscL [Paenibacillus macquariensis subsp. defensor]OAB39754.1 mechanosensitive ion channel protein MscL [Paenibacillus macquariensis subsp. macquariensis]SIR19739.1 large conductance mechanosensitive channel [Paenibacillus macquariensis]
MDLAVAVIIGAAFGKIVTSLVNDLLMPLIGLLLGGKNFSGLELPLGDAVLKYGLFIQTVIDFIIISFSIFLFIKLLSQFKRKEEVQPSEPPAPSNEEVLLTEIRDLLKQQSQGTDN